MVKNCEKKRNLRKKEKLLKVIFQKKGLLISENSIRISRIFLSPINLGVPRPLSVSILLICRFEERQIVSRWSRDVIFWMLVDPASLMETIPFRVETWWILSLFLNLSVRARKKISDCWRVKCSLMKNLPWLCLTPTFNSVAALGFFRYAEKMSFLRRRS